MKYSVLFIVSVLIAAALIAGCTQQAATQTSTTPQGTIKVGVIASLTGPASNVGTNMWQSAQVAADKISDGLGGFVVEASAALTILLYLGWLRFAGTWNQTSSAPGVFWSVLTGREFLFNR